MVYIGKTGLDWSELVPLTAKEWSWVVRFGSLNIWVSPEPVVLHGCSFWGQKTGLNQTCQHYMKVQNT